MKRALKIIAGLFVLFIIVIIGFVMTFDVNQYKGQIVKVVQQKTERSFSIDGDLHLEPSLIPTIAVEGVKFGNAEWGSKPDMVTVGKFEAQIALLPLLSRNIEVKRLILNNTNILLEKNKKGVANWTLAIDGEKTDESKKAPEPSTTALPALDINEVIIKDSSLTYSDAATGQIEKVRLRELDVKAGGYSAPLEVFLDASYNGIPVSLSGTGGSLKKLVKKEVYELDVSSKIGKIDADLAGKIADLQQLKGLDVNIDISVDNLQDIGVIIKQELPDVGPVEFKASIADKDAGYVLKSLTASIDKLSLNADGEIKNVSTLSGIKLNFDASVGKLSDLNKLARAQLPDMGPFTLNGTATDIEGGYKLSGFKLGLDKTDLAGEASINLSGKRPALTLNTTSNVVDLTPFISEEEAKKSTEEKSKVFSAEPLPFDLLKKADVNASIKAGKIQHPSLPLENVTLSLTLNNGNLNIKPLEFGALGTAAKLTLGLDASSGKSGKLKTRLDLKGLELSKMPNNKGKIEGAKTDVEIDVTGSGASVAEIMAGLNGKFLTKIGPGKIKSSKSDEENRSLLLMTFNNVYGSMMKNETILECGVINANIEDGVATLDKGIAMQTKAMNLVGSGMINFKTEELEIGIDPEARKGLGLSVGQLAELVAIRGTLANPKAGPSTKEALKTAASVGAAVMTGGLSILAQGLFDRATSDDNPCLTAMGESVEPSKKADKQKQTSEPKKSSSDALQDKIRNIFN